MDFKYCTKCNEEKSLDCFSKDKSRKGGLQVYCKVCAKKYKQTEAVKAVQAKYKQTEAGKAAQRRGHAKHPSERKARTKVNHAITAGRLVRPEKCSVVDCESTRVEAHHYLGYEEEHWLDVEWFCKKHHMEADRLESSSSEKRSGDSLSIK